MSHRRCEWCQDRLPLWTQGHYCRVCEATIVEVLRTVRDEVRSQMALGIAVRPLLLRLNLHRTDPPPWS